MRILVVKPSSLGDIIHGLQVVESLKSQFEKRNQSVEIHWVIRDLFADFLTQSPLVTHCFIFHRNGGFFSFLKLIAAIRKESYDWVLDLQGLARSALITFFAKGKRKIGRADAREGARLLYGEKISFPEKSLHALDILKNFLPKLGLEPRLQRSLSIRTYAWPYHFPKQNYIALFPNSRRPEKEWPYFVELTHLLLKKLPFNVVWLGQTLPQGAESIHETRLHNLIGKTSLAELPGLIKEAKCIVANDSGPMHLAAALEKPLVALFGPTEKERFGPYPLESCRHRILVGEGKKIGVISADCVAETVMELMNQLKENCV